eukprot:1551808-Amphidinium_carterae.1
MLTSDSMDAQNSIRVDWMHIDTPRSGQPLYGFWGLALAIHLTEAVESQHDKWKMGNMKQWTSK